MQYHHEPLHILNIFTYLMFNYKILKILLLIFTFHCFLFFLMFIYLFIGHAKQHVGSQFSSRGLNPCSTHWKHRVLTTGRPGKSLIVSFLMSPFYFLLFFYFYFFRKMVHCFFFILFYFIFKPETLY